MDAQIIRGNCLHHLSRLADDSVDAFVTDPPYGIELQLGTSRNPRRIAGDGRLEARKLWRDFLPHAHRLAKPDTAHHFFGTWKSIWIADLLAEHFAIKGCIVWYKRPFGLGYYLRPQWELAWYCHKGKPPRPAKAPSDVWEHARPARPLHPCHKPTDLLRRAIRQVLPPECRDPAAPPLVVDPFAGIGSTAVAAVQEHVRFLGIEIDPRYATLARQRIAAAQAERGSDNA
jgi:site-specific DNA-methyltransferase (adenine-specific)